MGGSWTEKRRYPSFIYNKAQDLNPQLSHWHESFFLCNSLRYTSFSCKSMRQLLSRPKALTQTIGADITNKACKGTKSFMYSTVLDGRVKMCHETSWIEIHQADPPHLYKGYRVYKLIGSWTQRNCGWPKESLSRYCTGQKNKFTTAFSLKLHI